MHSFSIPPCSCPSPVSWTRPSGDSTHQHSRDDSRWDHSQAQHRWAGHGRQRCHGKGTLWQTVQLDCEQDQPRAQFWEVSTCTAVCCCFHSPTTFLIVSFSAAAGLHLLQFVLQQCALWKASSTPQLVHIIKTVHITMSQQSSLQDKEREKHWHFGHLWVRKFQSKFLWAAVHQCSQWTTSVLLQPTRVCVGTGTLYVWWRTYSRGT